MKTIYLIHDDTKVHVNFSDEIKSLDLERIKWKLSDEEHGKGWSREKCDFVEEEYKKFLTIIKLNPKKEIVPSRIIDEFWHQHILDTKSYAEDCQKVFGRFLHHYPYFGMNGKEDQINLNIAFEETKRIYKSLFGKKTKSPDFVNKLGLEAARCSGPHVCHAPTSCACRAPGTCN
jgi:hypothetical protein